MVAFVIDEHLGLIGQPPESRGVNDAVAVALEWGAQRAARFLMKTPAAGGSRTGIGGDGALSETAGERHLRDSLDFAMTPHSICKRVIDKKR